MQTLKASDRVEIIGTRGCMDHVGRMASVVRRVPGTSWYIVEVEMPDGDNLHAAMRRIDLMTEIDFQNYREEDEMLNRHACSYERY